jgi:hypothetical protein
MTAHKATPKQWAETEAQVKDYPYATESCLLELRARVEALEAAQPDEEADIVDYYAALSAQHQGRAVFHGNSKPTPNPSQIRSSLVSRVSKAICYAQQRDETGSRAAIREVAAWLREQQGDVGLFNAGLVLDKEAER